ncbi:sugar diacid utilization regulator/putative methionine-R-sulfoxide reductase with GAF domain [Bacillus thermophilus]|uniref:Sugar diacid utilization regulator/putative methionine-R-sulfoxide reductase with GAF domain n=1 Tax=Siminovitchia thermophila TaxID=1245522 RepID=A0ABS2R636_9BACI|nr:GAF domain-containing protein [Siminovitchia thermophila]MBM7714619.1 sugar diacid utilization regulator/putative methionine-R-sulfoxide reductase with GAF domain [Siminovitchia thermophila]ONK22668.1 hypothetical protein BLX87_14935 [Bacillus sp. VT-16-64]
MENVSKDMKLFEMNLMLTQSLDKQTTLSRLVQSAFELIDQADTVILYYLEDDGLLHFADGMGVHKEAIRHVTFRPGESLTGTVFQKKTTMTACGETVKTYMKTMSKENHRYLQRGVYNRDIQSVICSPLLYKGECIGVLAVDNFDEKGEVFSDEEGKLVEIIASQAAIAIVNAQLFEDLNRRNEELHFSLDVHEKFTKILLEGSGTSQIMKVLERILDEPVYYSEINDEDGNQFPIISAHETLGYLQIRKPIHHLTKLQLVALQQAATAMALELIKQNAIFERDVHIKDELFHEILEGAPFAHTLKNQKQMGLGEFQEVTCIIISGKIAPLWDPKTVFEKEHFIRYVEDCMKRIQPQCVILTRGYDVIILVSHISKESLREFKKQLLKKSKQAENITIGVGNGVPIHDLVISYREAVESVVYAKREQQRPLVLYSELGTVRLWQSLDFPILKKFVDDQLGPLLDKNYQEEFHTLKTYMNMDRQHKEVANMLVIHPNTLSYRLRKAEGILGISLQNGRDWKNIHTALEILEFINTDL